MKNKLLLTALFGIVIVIGIVLLLKKEKPSDSGMILFYKDECPFCKNVEEYIKENKVDEKIKFERKEVYYNKDNAGLLLEKAKICGLPEDEIGVPFFWDGSKCLVGDRDIINFFEQRIK